MDNWVVMTPPHPPSAPSPPSQGEKDARLKDLARILNRAAFAPTKRGRRCRRQMRGFYLPAGICGTQEASAIWPVVRFSLSIVKPMKEMAISSVVDSPQETGL